MQILMRTVERFFNGVAYLAERVFPYVFVLLLLASPFLVMGFVVELAK